MKLNEYTLYLIDWLKQQLVQTKAKGYILGVSGGIDSALAVALLAKVTPNVLGVIMPCHSHPDDEKDAIMICQCFNVSYVKHDLSSLHDILSNELFAQKENDSIASAKANTKARLRMTTLYALGQSLSYLVIGTDNKDEWHTGYFTKYGDGGADLVPLIHLNKREIRQGAKLLGVPQKIIERIPSAGLTNNQSDEDDLKVSYEQLDDYLDGEPVSERAKQRIEYLHQISEHKRNIAIRPKEFKK